MSSGRARRVLLTWGLAILAVLCVLAAVVAVVDPSNDAMWVWVGAAVVVLAAREAYARYLRDEVQQLDPFDRELEDR